MTGRHRLERRPKERSLFDRAIIVRAIGDSLKKLDPRWQARNPVMFVVEVGAVVTSYFFVRAGSPTWPQGGIAPPDLGRISIFTVILLASSVPIFWAESAVRRGRIGQDHLHLRRAAACPRGRSAHHRRGQQREHAAPG